MQLGLSKRKHLPSLFLDNSVVAFPLWAYSYVKRFEKSKLSLSPYAQNVLSELRCNLYKPPFSLKGKTILDLGACCGEPCRWPVVVKVHSEELRNRFEMLGFSVAKRFVGSNYVCFVMNNFLFMEVEN